jgi:Putative amidase domain
MKNAHRALIGFLATVTLVLTPIVAHAEPPRRLPEHPLHQNHTLKYEAQCGSANGRFSWRGTKGAQCHLMDDGKIVALHVGKKLKKYTGTPVERELAYIKDYWYTTGPTGKYSYIPNENCANFVSQALHARGWKETSNWYNKAGNHSPAWTSSTALGKYLKLKGAVKLSDSKKNRKRISVGDVVQFDWERDGKTNHSAIVTKIIHKDGEIKIFVAESADPYEYRSMNEMIHLVHPGGKAWFWKLPA